MGDGAEGGRGEGTPHCFSSALVHNGAGAWRWILAMCAVVRAPDLPPRLWLFVAVTTALGVPHILHAAARSVPKARNQANRRVDKSSA